MNDDVERAVSDALFHQLVQVVERLIRGQRQTRIIDDGVFDDSWLRSEQFDVEAFDRPLGGDPGARPTGEDVGDAADGIDRRQRVARRHQQSWKRRRQAQRLSRMKFSACFTATARRAAGSVGE
jgi:hypothetical protein